MDGLINILFLKVGHLSICFWVLDAQISAGRNLWVGGDGRSFIHDGWLKYVTVCCYKVYLQFLHCYGEFFICSWSKVKSLASQVSILDLEVSLSFGLQAWFILRFLTSVLLGLGG